MGPLPPVDKLSSRMETKIGAAERKNIAADPMPMNWRKTVAKARESSKPLNIVRSGRRATRS